MAIESGANEPPIRHDGLIEVDIAVAARTDDKGTPQIGIVIRDEEGEPFAGLGQASVRISNRSR